LMRSSRARYQSLTRKKPVTIDLSFDREQFDGKGRLADLDRARRC
jgi:hypothetical protein